MPSNQLRECECAGPRPLVQGIDRRSGPESGKVRTFCRRCNGEVRNKEEIRAFTEESENAAER